MLGIGVHWCRSIIKSSTEFGSLLTGGAAAEHTALQKDGNGGLKKDYEHCLGQI